MEKDIEIQRLRRQLRIERTAFISVALLAIFVWIYSGLSSNKSLILIDGKPVVCVPTKNDANYILDQLKSETGYNPSEIEFKQEITVARAPRDANTVSRHKAYRVLKSLVSPVVPRWAILVDGEPIVALPDRETAGAVLDQAKIKFGRLVENLAEEPQFKEKVTVEIASVSPSIYCKTVDEALSLIFNPKKTIKKDAVYTVHSGDMAVSIARKHGLSLDELASLNPGIDLAHLQIGDKLRVKASAMPKPKLTVVVRDQIQREETIPAPLQKISSARLLQDNKMNYLPDAPERSL